MISTIIEISKVNNVDLSVATSMFIYDMDNGTNKYLSNYHENVINMYNKNYSPNLKTKLLKAVNDRVFKHVIKPEYDADKRKVSTFEKSLYNVFSKALRDHSEREALSRIHQRNAEEVENRRFVVGSKYSNGGQYY